MLSIKRVQHQFLPIVGLRVVPLDDGSLLGEGDVLGVGRGPGGQLGKVAEAVRRCWGAGKIYTLVCVSGLTEEFID